MSKKQEKLDGKTVLKALKGSWKIVIFLIAVIFVANFITQCSVFDVEYETATVMSIKDGSAGTLFSSDVCVYETTKGDIVNDCVYDAGDEIVTETRYCKLGEC